MKMTEKEHKALQRVLEYGMPDEGGDWLANGKPTDHIYNDYVILSDWLIKDLDALPDGVESLTALIEGE